MDACCAHKYPQHNTVITWSLRQLDLESGCCSIIKSFFFFFKSRVGEFPVCPVVRTLYSAWGQIQSLVEELRSHKWGSMARGWGRWGVETLAA